MIKSTIQLESFKKELVTLCQKYGTKLTHEEDGMSIEFVLDEYDGYSQIQQDKIFAFLPGEIISEDD